LPLILYQCLQGSTISLVTGACAALGSAAARPRGARAAGREALAELDGGAALGGGSGALSAAPALGELAVGGPAGSSGRNAGRARRLTARATIATAASAAPPTRARGLDTRASAS
jgi:hypothetical protein